MRRSAFLAEFFSGTVQDRLSAGYALFRDYGKSLQTDPEFGRLFDELAKRQTELAALMRNLGLGRICSDCGARCGGCCSSEMAGQTDAVQICLNLMAGVEIRLRGDAATCGYLGGTGCSFRFKPMFCLNYHCTAIKWNLEPFRFTALEQAVGTVLGAHYVTETRLLDCCRQEADRCRSGAPASGTGVAGQLGACFQNGAVPSRSRHPRGLAGFGGRG